MARVKNSRWFRQAERRAQERARKLGRALTDVEVVEVAVEAFLDHHSGWSMSQQANFVLRAHDRGRDRARAVAPPAPEPPLRWPTSAWVLPHRQTEGETDAE